MLAFLLLLHAAAAQDPLRVGPRTGDFPTIIDVPDQPVATWIVRRSVDWTRFGPLPVKRHFAAEMAATLAHIAPLAPAEPVSAGPTEPPTTHVAEPPAAP